MRRVFLTACSVFISYSFFAQTLQKKEYTARRITEAPKIDGLLNDSCWQNLSSPTDFIQLEPEPGLPSRLKSEVKVVYDNSAIYVGAMLYDHAPDSILRELSKRDNVVEGPNADAFGFLFDTYQDGINAYAFIVSAAGVQSDARISGEDFDDSWNAVWESKIFITDNGWIAEFKIPYSALRFPKKEMQEWGVNFTRIIKRYREFANWNPINPEVNGFVNQSGVLKGVSSIESPLRLAFSPYVSAYADNYNGNNSYLFNGGADVKYGINESFTLDMTLIPDFGQARSDDKVLNLSPFEVLYDEQRSFFTEGTDLFNRANLFYSRRVGGTPLGYEGVYEQTDSTEEVIDNPLSTQLYNATKISGRTKKKLGIGFFNATSAPTYAVVRDTVTGATSDLLTQPLSNYNVMVFDQALRNNSYISIINTNVTRNGGTYDANVTGTQFRIADEKNKFAVMGSGSLSRLYYTDSAKPVTGHRYRIALAKISGNYTNEIYYRTASDRYDNNDLGYIDRNNDAGLIFNQSYNIYKPFWIINKMTNDLGIDNFWLYKPRTYTKFNVDWETNIDFRNYFTWGLTWAIQPLTNFDYYEPRVAGRYYIYPKNYEMGTYFSSDYRKRFALDGGISYRTFNERERTAFSWSIEPRYRLSDKFNMSYSFFTKDNIDDAGFVDFSGDTIIFGVRNVNTKVNTLQGNYIFTSTMSLSLRARHYWSQVKYKDYFALNEEGMAAPTSYTGNNDINFNAFNIDMVLTWQFLPGSEMSAVWKNAILTNSSVLLADYLNNFNATLDSPQLNSFSIKVLYYLDYQKLKRRR